MEQSQESLTIAHCDSSSLGYSHGKANSLAPWDQDMCTEKVCHKTRQDILVYGHISLLRPK